MTTQSMSEFGHGTKQRSDTVAILRLNRCGQIGQSNAVVKQSGQIGRELADVARLEVAVAVRRLGLLRHLVVTGQI